MKRFQSFSATLLLALASAWIPASAQDTSETRQAAVQRYLQAMPMAKMMEDMYSEMAKQMPPDRRDEFVSSMRRIVRVERVEEISRQSMLKTFTTGELNALADFYSSKEGASAMSKFGAYMGEVMPSLIQEIRNAAQEVHAEKK
jgi:hypothetical protein